MSALEIYKNLEQYTELLEAKFKKNSEDFLQLKQITRADLDLDKQRDYHYKEILTHLSQIKQHLTDIANHDHELDTLTSNGNNRQSIVDKNYIRKQIETFQKISQNETVHRRQHKPNRPPETSSYQYVQSWERFLDKQEEEFGKTVVSDAPVSKRQTIPRKNKKIVSSTVDMFLDNSTTDDSSSLESLKEEIEDGISQVVLMEQNKSELFQEEEDESNKPKIVGMMLKNKTESSNEIEVCGK